MSPFFKNDDGWISPHSSVFDNLPFNMVSVKINNLYCKVLDEIFPSCSGMYYIQHHEDSIVRFIPIDMVSLPENIISKDENSFIYQHLEEYKTKMIRTKKLNRIL